MYFSFSIVHAEYSYDVKVEKRHRGSRLDPNKRFLPSEFQNILFYDDIHLPNRNESIVYRNQTWHVLSEAFSNLFHNDTIQLLARYHFQTAASILGSNRTNRVLYKDRDS